MVIDDISDNDRVRRGKESAWRKYGICTALHSSLYVIPECQCLLNCLKSNNSDKVRHSFWDSYQEVCRCQMGQVNLDLTENLSYDDFLTIHLGKTVLGRWAITAPAMLYGNNEYAKIFCHFAERLGDAGSLKNDVEDFMQDDGFEPFCTDIRTGNLTYPLYYYFGQCPDSEKNRFQAIFGNNREIDYLELKQKIIKKGTISHCIEKIQKSVDDAIKALHILPQSNEKDLLIAWARHHLLH